MSRSDPPTCVICGHTPWDGKDVTVALIHWAEDGKFGAGPRCKDREECRRRVHEAGERWPIKEVA